MAHGAKYERLKEAAVLALLTHAGIADAARAVGLSERGLRKWMEKREFQEAIRAVRQQVLSAGTSRLAGLVARAVETLERCLSSSRDAEAVKAARAVLEFATKMEHAELEARLAELESQVKSMRPGNTTNVRIAGDANICISPEVLASVLAIRRELGQRTQRVEVIENRPAELSTYDVPRHFGST
jgi:hypothetical protein